MKRILALLLVALMLIGLCACGNSAQEGAQSAQGTDTSKAEANLSSNESILLSGYWIDKDEITFTFNKNGTAHIEGGDATPHDVKWTLEDDTVTCEWMGMVETFTLEKTDTSYTLTSYETVLSLVTESSAEKKENQKEKYVILNNDGEKHEVSYLFDMARNNELKWNKFKEDGGYIEMVATLNAIKGETRYKIDSYSKYLTSYVILIEDDMHGGNQLIVDTSGLEDIIMDWELGDIIKIKCKITHGNLNLLYTFQTDDNEIEIEKVQ